MKNKLFKVIYAVFALLITVLIVLSGRNDKSVALKQDDLTYNDEMTDFYTPGLLLHGGTYKISIFYASDADVRMDFFGNANDNYIETLPSSIYGNTFEKEYVLTKDSQGSKLRFEVPEGSVFYVSDIVIESNALLYNDSLLFAFMAAAILTAAYLIISSGIYKKINREQAAAWLIMAAALILAFSPHLSGKLYDGNDLGGQLIRLEGVKDAIINRQFPIVLFPRTLHEYGELGAMYPYLFLVFPALLRVLNISLLTVYDLTILCTCTAVLLTAYYCLRTMSVSCIASALSSVIYLLAPAFIHGETDNGAMLGAGIAYIFIPLVLTGLIHVLKGRRDKWMMLTIGFSGMLQSHLVTTLLMMPCALFVIVIISIREAYAGRIKKENFLSIIKAGIWCIPLNIWWIVLLFYYYIKGDLYMGALGNSFSGMELEYFFSLEATQYSLLIMLAAAAAMFILRYRKGRLNDKDRDDIFLASVLLMLGWILLFLCTKLVAWEALRSIPAIRFFTDTMQFPTRFYVVVSACSAIPAGFVLDKMLKEKGKHGMIVTVTVSVLIFAAAVMFDYGFIKEYLSDDNFFCSRIIGDISPFKQREYLPDGTDDEFYQGRYGFLVSDEEKVKIEGYSKREDKVSFTYYADESADNAYAELPMFYYPGYEAVLNDGTELYLETGEDNHMRIYLPPAGSGQEVRVRFKVKLIFSILSVFSTCMFIVFIYFNVIYVIGKGVRNEHRTGKGIYQADGKSVSDEG